MANRACARHILVKTRDQAEAIKKQLKRGADFGKLAKKHSFCPSAKRFGDLGEFRRGQMVKPFDDVVFKKTASCCTWADKNPVWLAFNRNDLP